MSSIIIYISILDLRTAVERGLVIAGELPLASTKVSISSVGRVSGVTTRSLAPNMLPPPSRGFRIHESSESRAESARKPSPKAQP